MPLGSELSQTARRLGSVLEPVIGQVYFSPECHANYVALGFDPSPGNAGGVALPDGPAYFTSRGSVMGQVAGDVIAAAFAVFNPAVVVPLVEIGWQRTDAPTICDARTDGAVAQLRRILGDDPAGLDRAVELMRRAIDPLRPEGRPLYAGVRSLGVPEEPLAAMWRMGDQLREYRGDSHTMAWGSRRLRRHRDRSAHGALLGIVDAHVQPARERGPRPTSTPPTDRLRSRGLIDGDGFTTSGREAREAIEVATDAQMRPALDALGDDVVELCSILDAWGAAVRAGGGYLANGPHDLGGRG